MGPATAGSRTSDDITGYLSYTFSHSPSLLCFPLCGHQSQARDSSHCVGKMVISNYRLKSTRLIASRKEITILPILSCQIMRMTLIGPAGQVPVPVPTACNGVLYLAMPGSWAQRRTGGLGQHLREQNHR